MAASRTISSEDRRTSGTGLNSLTPLVPPACQPLVRRGIDFDHEVVTVFDRVDHPVLGDDFELDLRIGRREARADRAGRDMRKHHGRADLEPSAWRGCGRSDRLAAFLGETRSVWAQRSTKRTPRACSSSATPRDSVAFGRPVARLARLKPPWTATGLNSVSACRPVQLFQK
jgi:hypothetical protein